MTAHRYAQWLLAIALTHFSLGVLFFWSELGEIARAGVFASLSPDNLNTAVAFWFLMFSLPLLTVSAALWHNQQAVGQPVIVMSLVSAGIGCVLMPASGFWTLLVLALVALWRNRSPAMAHA